jgi:hypothetical protein
MSRALQPNRGYLIVTAPCEVAGQQYRPGDLISTRKGRARSFMDDQRAYNHRNMHLGVDFPVQAKLGQYIAPPTVKFRKD